MTRGQKNGGKKNGQRTGKERKEYTVAREAGEKKKINEKKPKLKKKQLEQQQQQLKIMNIPSRWGTCTVHPWPLKNMYTSGRWRRTCTPLASEEHVHSWLLKKNMNTPGQWRPNEVPHDSDITDALPVGISQCPGSGGCSVHRNQLQPAPHLKPTDTSFVIL